MVMCKLSPASYIAVLYIPVPLTIPVPVIHAVKPRPKDASASPSVSYGTHNDAETSAEWLVVPSDFGNVPDIGCHPSCGWLLLI